MTKAPQRDGRGAASRQAATILRAFGADRYGTTAIEYGMIGFLVFAVAAGAIRVYGSKVNNVYNNIGTTISQAQ